MSDKDIMIYLKNAALAISKLAVKRNIRVSFIISNSGYVKVMAGDYEYTKFPVKEEEYFEYAPYGKDLGLWRKISPDQIHFGQEAGKP